MSKHNASEQECSDKRDQSPPKTSFFQRKRSVKNGDDVDIKLQKSTIGKTLTGISLTVSFENDDEKFVKIDLTANNTTAQNLLIQVKILPNFLCLFTIN